MLSAAATAGERPVVLVLGDSLSAAYGMPVEQGWVRLLQQRLDADHYPYTIVNASISGDTTANALDRLPQELIRHQPVIVGLELGGNDGLRGYPTDLVRSNLVAGLPEAVGRRASEVLSLTVRAADGSSLAPCHPARARALVRRGRWMRQRV